jgi:hypothetical protein
MAVINILYDAPSFSGTFSGGSWAASLPVSNLMIAQPGKVARSSDALAASTQFVCDHGATLAIQMFALVNHNLSSAATIRWRVSTHSDLSSALIDVTIDANAPNLIYGSLPWGVFPWDWFSEETQPGGFTVFYKNTSAQYGRYSGINITDTTNADGYAQAGVYLDGVPFIPSINFVPGAGIGLVDPSKQTRAVGGSLYTDVRPKYRTFTASLEWLTEAEAIGGVYRMRNMLGISEPLLLIVDPDATDGTLAAGTIYGRLVTISDPIRFARNTVDYIYSATIEIEELI